MNIIISPEALAWFNDEMETQAGDAVRFFARYGGDSKLHEGFSLGMTKEQPDEVAIQVLHDDILFYIEARDEWYFDNRNLYVNLDTKQGEITFSHE